MKVSSLDYSISSLRGVGPKRAEALSKRGISRIIDLFFFLPRGYEDRSRFIPVSELKEDKPALARGRIVRGEEEKLFGPRKRLYKIVIANEKEILELVWFNIKRQQLESFAIPGAELAVYGTVKCRGKVKQMYHPDISLFNRDEKLPGFLPLYPSVETVSDKILRSIINKAMDSHLEDLADPLPDHLLKNVSLPGLREAVRFIHSPDIESDFELLNRGETIFQKRLVFDRFFRIMLAVAFKKSSREKISVPPMNISPDLSESLSGYFPFCFTNDQKSAIHDISGDLAKGRPMNRLLMGDVGTGKTLVAACAAYMVTVSGRQAAFMAPTQMLAGQHMEYFASLPSEMGFRPVLLTGKMKRSERETVYKNIEQGHFNLVIGTHSLIQERVRFFDLGLVIIDEQHRFGVRQRALMEKKAELTPHMIVMSATPIPRTLAVTLYGDLDISVIREYPDIRVPVATHICDKSRKRWVFERLNSALSQGRQVYVICPVIDESEGSGLKSVTEMADQLQKILGPDFRTGTIHGRMDSAEKEDALNLFREGKTDVLVGTTVIEVGIHVPNANLMIIEHPECFGLAQLHQLRGRIGRDGKGGECILMLPESPSEATLARLNHIASCSDGFEIAQKDLELRGHGEMAGTRQSGFSELTLDEILRESDLFELAVMESRRLVNDDPQMTRPEHCHIKNLMEKLFRTGEGL